MPRYLYACSHCRKESEVEKRVALASRAESCPACGTAASRKFTPPALGNPSGAGSSASETAGGCATCCQNGACGLD